MKIKVTIISMLAVVLVAAVACVQTQPAEPAQQVTLDLFSHPAAGMAEQDVYIIGENEGEIIRAQAEGIDAYADAPVYGTLERIEHDPFNLGEVPFGPHEQGAELGFTMGEWLAATGQVVYTVQGDEAHLAVEMENLIPNGVYTIWCARFNTPPAFSIEDYPCGAADGSENVVTADENGAIDYEVNMATLTPSESDSINVIAAAYHSDGSTYGEYPGDFGFNAHVQIFTMIPGPDDAAWQTVESDALASR